MSDLNKVIVDGRLVAAAELSRWTDGTPYVKFTVGNNESYKDQGGNWISIGSFFDCLMKGNYAEAMSKHLLKGRGVHIVGRLKQQRWEKDGQKYSKIVIKVEELYLNHGGNFESSNNNQQTSQVSQPITQQYQQPAAPVEEQQYIPFGATEENFSEDIPF